MRGCDFIYRSARFAVRKLGVMGMDEGIELNGRLVVLSRSPHPRRGAPLARCDARVLATERTNQSGSKLQSFNGTRDVLFQYLWPR